MICVYSVCNSWHIFQGSHCPLDGWSSPDSIEIAEAVDSLDAAGTIPTWEALRAYGVSEQTLGAALIIDFPSKGAVFKVLEVSNVTYENKRITFLEYWHRVLRTIGR